MTDTSSIASSSLQATFDARDGFRPGVDVANHSAEPMRLKVTIDGSAEGLALHLIDGPGPVPAHETWVELPDDSAGIVLPFDAVPNGGRATL